jgi:hypothetical protein
MMPPAINNTSGGVHFGSYYKKQWVERSVIGSAQACEDFRAELNYGINIHSI